MNNKKRKISIILAVALCLSLLAACGADRKEEAVQPTATPSHIAATPIPQPTEQVQVEELAEEPAEPIELTAADRAAAKGLPTPPDVDITSWEFLLANSYNCIMFYEPPYGNIDGQGIDERIADVVNQLIQDARGEGLRMYMAAILRNYTFLNTYYVAQVYSSGNAYDASKIMLGPGCNEHQTGLAIDITDDPMLNCSYSIFDNSAILGSATYEWMLEHCTEYGFILRYPEGKEEYYGTPCTAGHFRYVGVEAAKYITENNLCLEEFIMLYDEDAVYIPEIK